jgi:hypothetical protein
MCEKKSRVQTGVLACKQNQNLLNVDAHIGFVALFLLHNCLCQRQGAGVRSSGRFCGDVWGSF